MPFAFLGLQAGRLSTNFTILARSTETNATQRMVVPVSLNVKRYPRLNMTAIPNSLSLPFLRGQPSLPARIPLINRGGVGLVNVTISVTSPPECSKCLRTDLTLDEKISILTQRTLSLQCLTSSTPIVSKHQVRLLIEEGPTGSPNTTTHFTVSCEPLGIAMLPSAILSGPSNEGLANISSLSERDESRSGKLFLSVVQDPCQSCAEASSAKSPGVSYLAFFVSADGDSEIVGYRPRVWLSRRLRFLNVNNLIRDSCNLNTSCAYGACAPTEIRTDAMSGLSDGKIVRQVINDDWTLTELVELRDADDVKQAYVFTNFSFPFFDELHSQMLVSSNGFIAFEDWQHDRDWAPALSTTEKPNKVIAPLWGDLSVRGSVSVLESRNALIVQWHQLTNYAAPAYGTYTFQLILLRSGVIIFAYKSVPSIEALQVKKSQG